VKKAKTYFQQIPVEVVKKIAKELPQNIKEERVGNGKGGLKPPNVNTEPASRTSVFASQKERLK